MACRTDGRLRPSHLAASGRPAPAAAALRTPARTSPASGARLGPIPQEDGDIELLQGDVIVRTYAEAKDEGGKARLLDPREVELVEPMNSRAPLLRKLVLDHGVIIPPNGKVGLLTYGGPHVGTPLVEEVVCMGCGALVSGGAYMKPGGRHHYVFCWSVQGEQKKVNCVDLMCVKRLALCQRPLNHSLAPLLAQRTPSMSCRPYYVKKYIQKNFKQIHEESKKLNSQARQ